MLSSVLTRSPNALRRQITQTRGIWTRLSPSARSTPSMKRPPAQGWRQNSSYRARNNMGVFTPKSAAVFIAAGVGLFFYFRYEKERLLEEREKERQSKAYGRPKLGGPTDMKGKWSLVYFGFTNCPDICPAELDKITDVLNVVQKDHGDIFLPLFVTVDPARDLPHRIGRYLGDFHPSNTVSISQHPPNADPNGDYLVDHSIFVYLMDPDGKFVGAFGQVVTGEEFIEKIGKSISEYEQETGRKA
ncbi:h-sco1 [Coprinopsis sp. MPI-PUGE-AT-0042]|nr:h-sco1 [Coprinopsis sp. MPI-PUGE-AT-0042]